MSRMFTPLRLTGLPPLGAIPWGGHLCLFYETKQDLLDANAAYFSAGLQDNEFCLWVISEPITEQEARAALAAVVPDFARHLAEGRIEFLPAREWYLEGKKFDPSRITGSWEEKLRKARAGGFAGMRASGNAAWLATDYWNAFQDYERELHQSLAGQSMIILCTYPLQATRGNDVLDVASSHTVTLTYREGVWEVVEAFGAVAERSVLTGRESEVLTWVARGKSAREIGRILQISKRTVDEHVNSAIRKLGAANRTQAAIIATRDRIIDPSSASI